jgi:hypothetical protein
MVFRTKNRKLKAYKGVKTMKDLISVLLPAKAGNTILGTKWPFIVFVIMAVIGTVRSLVHMFSADGGAGSIAGMNLAVSGAEEVIFAFALWGSAQMIYALLQWLVIFRYRSLVPLMWAMQAIETLLRMVVDQVKPVNLGRTPPSIIQNDFYLAVSVLMLALTLWSGIRAARKLKRGPKPGSGRPDLDGF